MQVLEPEKLAILRLMQSEKIGPITFWNLIKLYGSAIAAIHHIQQFASYNSKNGSRYYKVCDAKDVTKIVDNIREIGGECIWHSDENFPSLLRGMPDCPPILYTKHPAGLLKKLNESLILSVVGTRAASLNGQKLIYQWCQQLATEGVVIVSGLARGIDTAAHKGAIGTGLTVCILPCGIDEPYPPENVELYDNILHRGIAIAEHPCGTPLHAQRFPQRNRIIAGIAHGTLVIEASKKSGSLITANYAVDYGRDVMAVPGFPGDLRSYGTNWLIKQGACLVDSVEDVIDALKHNTKIKDIDYRNSIQDTAYLSTEPSVNEILEMREQLMQLLSPAPLLISDIIEHLSANPRTVMTAIVQLQLLGYLTYCGFAAVAKIIQDE